MKKRALFLALALSLSLGLVGCYEPAEPEVDENGHSEPIADMTVVANGSLTAVVVDKSDDGITLEITNSGNENTVAATFTSAKMGGRDYQINQATYESSPLSIMRAGEDKKTVNLSLPSNDFARVTVSSSDLSSADDYNNVDLYYNETYMGDNGPITKTNQTISIKNA
jgi:hypothetical protein